MARALFAAALLGCALLLAGPLAARASDDVDEKDVVVLTDKNFDEKIGAAKFALVEFYAPWCGHCKSLKPEYAKAATALKAYDADIVIGKVDATEEKEVAGKHEVQGYPTLKWFIDGKLAMDYSGGRTADDIIRWVKKKTGPATTEVPSADKMGAVMNENKLFVLGYFASLDSDECAAFNAAAVKSDDAAFFKTTDKAAAAKLGLKSPGYALGRTSDLFGFEAVISEGHKAFAENKEDLSAALEAFINAEKLPAFTEFSQETSSAIFGSGISHQVIVTAPGTQFSKGQPLFNALTAAAASLKGKVVMVIAKVESDNGKPIIDYFGLDKEGKEAQVVGFDSAGGKKFKFEGKATGEELIKFGEAVVAGTAKKFFKSAAEPAQPLDKGVAVVVGNTVESIVKDPKRDVLLEVYAPWCGHCKSLAPIYEKLAKRFAKIDSVVIAKMDGTENEHPEIESQGYPTLVFFPAEEGAAPIPYEGGRTLGEMTKFIKKHAKVAFELPKKKGAKKEEEDAKDEL